MRGQSWQSCIKKNSEKKSVMDLNVTSTSVRGKCPILPVASSPCLARYLPSWAIFYWREAFELKLICSSRSFNLEFFPPLSQFLAHFGNSRFHSAHLSLFSFLRPFSLLPLLPALVTTTPVFTFTSRQKLTVYMNDLGPTASKWRENASFRRIVQEVLRRRCQCRKSRAPPAPNVSIMQEMHARQVTRKEKSEGRRPIRTKNATKHHFGAKKAQTRVVWDGKARLSVRRRDLNGTCYSKKGQRRGQRNKGKRASRQLPKTAFIWRSMTEGLSMSIRQSAKMCCRLLLPQTASTHILRIEYCLVPAFLLCASLRSRTKFTALLFLSTSLFCTFVLIVSLNEHLVSLIPISKIRLPLNCPFLYSVHFISVPRV